MSQRRILDDIYNERRSQDQKWGSARYRADCLWSDVLGEEVVEVSRAILNRDRDNLKKELVQVAAVCVAWLERIQHEELLENIGNEEENENANG